MKNLYDRLSPENQDKLKQELKLYPKSVQSVIDDLNKNEYWLDLTYDKITMLVTYLNLKDYSPVTINKLFNN